MPGAEAERGKARVDSLPVVVVVSYVQLARVFSGVVIGVADERTLPLSNMLGL